MFDDEDNNDEEQEERVERKERDQKGSREKKDEKNDFEDNDMEIDDKKSPVENAKKGEKKKFKEVARKQARSDTTSNMLYKFKAMDKSKF
jgi:hypothetical protein